MTDEELLAALIGLFEDRAEAEHVVQCDECDVHGDIECGPYRCAENPVSVVEAAKNRVIAEGAKLVWFLRGCPPMSQTAWVMQQTMEAVCRQYKNELIRQFQFPNLLFERIRR